jgi:hypothetical protein
MVFPVPHPPWIYKPSDGTGWDESGGELQLIDDQKEGQLEVVKVDLV